MQSDETYLADMLIAARTAIAYLEGWSLDALMGDVIRRDAVVLQIFVLGEAARSISVSFQTAHAEIPWSSVIGMRNMLVHQYFRADIQVVWDTVKRDLPILVAAIQPLVPPNSIADSSLDERKE